jgi:hypothetical protein
MEKFFIAIGLIASAFGLIFLSPIIGVLIGAFSGWVVGWLAPVWVPTGLALLGLHVNAGQLVEVGAALGFLGGFFRVARPSNKGKED